MDAERERRAEDVFADVVRLPADEWVAAVRGACGDDAEVLSRVESLVEVLRRVEAISVDATRTAGGGPTNPVRRPGDDEGPGSVIGPYKLAAVIGQGGFGVVYRAEQERPVRRQVALKVIKLGMDTREVVARFEAERQALALMDHPNIARVYEAGATDSGRPYFVMELVDGVPITAFCDAGRLTTGQRLALMVPVCRAVQHAHAKGIVHRDLKPSNVLVGSHDGAAVPTVIDFGIAKATGAAAGGPLTDRTLMTLAHQFVGTPAYMSPEQAGRDGLDVDTRADVYGLGALLYELLTGTPPVDPVALHAAAYDQVCRMIREAEPLKPSARIDAWADDRSGVDPAVIAACRASDPKRLAQSVRGEPDWIVMRAIEKDRTRRYETAAALADDLARYLAGEAVAAGPPGGVYRVRTFARRHRAWLGTVAVVAVALVLGVAGTTVGMVRARASQREADAGRADAVRAEASAVKAQRVAVRAQHEAEEQAATAKAVGDFEVGILGSADPYLGAGVKLTVLDAVRAAAERLRAGQMRDRPVVYAALLHSVGQTFRSLDRPDLAAWCYDGRLALVRRFAADAPPSAAVAARRELAASIDEWAMVNMEMGNAKVAEPLFRESMALWRDLDPDGPTNPTNQMSLASALNALGKGTDAEAEARAAFETASHPPPGRRYDVAATATTLANILRSHGKTKDALPLYQQAVDLYRADAHGPRSQVALALDELGGCLCDLNEPGKAEPLLAEGLAIDLKLLQPNQTRTRDAMRNLGRCLVTQGKYGQAAHVYQQRVDGDKAADPKARPWMLADDLYDLGDALARVNQPAATAEAMAAFRECFDLRVKLSPTAGPTLAAGKALEDLAARRSGRPNRTPTSMPG